MKEILFTKMVASGNDFVILDGIKHQLPVTNNSLAFFAKSICDRKYGAGADGLLILTKSKTATVKMRILNADGSEAEMCGNGARCAVFYVKSVLSNIKDELSIKTKAGIIKSEIKDDNIRIRFIEPEGLKLQVPVKIKNRILRANFINTGVPHAVIFVEGLDKIDVFNLGREIRYHKTFAPKGTNVDFVELLNNDSIRVRTYERGVEDETLACGTGSVASALITAYITQSLASSKINVHTKSGEVLKVYFKAKKKNFCDVWLEGKAGVVYKGAYYV